MDNLKVEQLYKVVYKLSKLTSVVLQVFQSIVRMDVENTRDFFYIKLSFQL